MLSTGELHLGETIEFVSNSITWVPYLDEMMVKNKNAHCLKLVKALLPVQRISCRYISFDLASS